MNIVEDQNAFGGKKKKKKKKKKKVEEDFENDLDE